MIFTIYSLISMLILCLCNTGYCDSFKKTIHFVFYEKNGFLSDSPAENQGAGHASGSGAHPVSI